MSKTGTPDADAKGTSVLAFFLSSNTRRQAILAVMAILLAIIPTACLPSLCIVIAGTAEASNWLLSLLFMAFVVLYVFVFIQVSKAAERESDILRKDIGKAIYERNMAIARCEEVKADNKLLRSVHSGLAAICSTNANMANSVIHEIVNGDGGGIKIEKHGFINTCDAVCRQIYGALVDRFGDASGFEVTYVRRDEWVKDELQIETIAHCTKAGSRISNEMRPRKQSKFYDYKLFEEGRTEVVALATPKEIQRNFYLKIENRNKYRQYIAYPVVCQTGQGNKMIGLLQVAILEKEILETKKELENLGLCILSPYCEALLLIHKLRKGLVAVPGNDNDRVLR